MRGLERFAPLVRGHRCIRVCILMPVPVPVHVRARVRVHVRVPVPVPVPVPDAHAIPQLITNRLAAS